MTLKTEDSYHSSTDSLIMRATTIALGCVLLATCLSYLPGTDGQACTAPDTPAGCTDCADPANAASPDCVPTTVAPVTTVAPTVATTVAGDSTVAGGETTTAASSSDTTTAATSGGTNKTKKVTNFTITRKPGKRVTRRRRKGGKKGWLFNKFGQPAPNNPPGCTQCTTPCPSGATTVKPK